MQFERRSWSSKTWMMQLRIPFTTPSCPGPHCCTRSPCCSHLVHRFSYCYLGISWDNFAIILVLDWTTSAFNKLFCSRSLAQESSWGLGGAVAPDQQPNLPDFCPARLADSAFPGLCRECSEQASKTRDRRRCQIFFFLQTSLSQFWLLARLKRCVFAALVQG